MSKNAKAARKKQRQGSAVGQERKPISSNLKAALQIVCRIAAGAATKDFNQSEARRVSFEVISAQHGIPMNELLNPTPKPKAGAAEPAKPTA